MRRGAAGIISEYDPPANFEGDWLKVDDAREALAKAAAVINGNPSHELDLIGITGTNGKTTTTYLCFASPKPAGKKAGDADDCRIPHRRRACPRPDNARASDTNRFLREAVDEGCTMAVMEASSQAIDLHRCDWLRFKVAVFTNLTRDHLDYHLHDGELFRREEKAFRRPSWVKSRVRALINIDDEWGVKLADELRSRASGSSHFLSEPGSCGSGPISGRGYRSLADSRDVVSLKTPQANDGSIPRLSASRTFTICWRRPRRHLELGV